MIFRLAHATARRLAHEAIDSAPDNWIVRVTEPTRSLEQNSLLHAAISDIAKQLKWCGETLSDEDWKRLLVAAWARAEKQPVRLIPAIDGQGFDALYRRTSRMTKAELSSLIEYLYAWGSDQGVKWSDHA